MDKNNDIQVNKVSKWEAAPESIKEMHYIITGVCDILNDYDDDNKCEKMMVDALSKVLDDYNELEAKHNTDCGLISEYEEENRNLKSELDIKTDECDDLISRVFKQDDEYTELKKENKELRETRELLNEVNSKQCAEVDDLEADIRDLEVQVRVNKGIASLYESEIKQVIDLAKSYGLIIYDDRKDAISDDVKNIGMCGHYYVLGRDLKNENDRLRNRCNELEKENKDLKDMIDKDGEFGRNVGERVADSIREGCDKGVYKLHLLTRIDIHVEETNNMPINMPFGRYAIPIISVIFNNTQTEMERDTAQHECEELNERIDRLWRVNDELNRKIKELKKENKELKATLAVCAVDANTAKKLCDGIVSKVKRTRNNKEEK